MTFGNWHWLVQAVNQGKSYVCIMYHAWNFVRGRPNFKAGMKQKFWSSFLPNCDLYPSEMASWTKKNIKMYVCIYFGPLRIPWIIGWLSFEISCKGQVFTFLNQLLELYLFDWKYLPECEPKMADLPWKRFDGIMRHARTNDASMLKFRLSFVVRPDPL